MSDRILSFDSALDEIRDLNADEQLSEWLIQVLDRRVPGVRRLPGRWTSHAFVSRLYRKSDLLLKERLGRAYSRLLVSFEPEMHPNREATEGDREYLFNLISLASTIRAEQAKARLRRWLYLEVYRDWEYDNFNLHKQILLATAAYDPDDAWVSYVHDTLPTKSYYERVALASYRALLQTKGIDCLSLLPRVLGAVPPSHEKRRKSFGYLLGLTMSRFGREVFLSKAAETLNSGERDVAALCSNALRLEDFLEDAFPQSQKWQMSSCVDHLRLKVLQPAVRRLHGLKPEEKASAVVDLIAKKPPEKIYRLSWVPGCALVFPRKFEILIDEKTNSLLPNPAGYEEVNPLNSAIAAMNPPNPQPLAAYARGAGASAGGASSDEDDF